MPPADRGKEPHYRCCSSVAQTPGNRYDDRDGPAKRQSRNEVNMSDQITELEAAAFRRLLLHLNARRTDVQNIDLMILAGFCRNCLADWYREAGEARGVAMSKDEAREHVYGEPYSQWKSKHQKEATPEQLAAFAAAQARS